MNLNINDIIIIDNKITGKIKYIGNIINKEKEYIGLELNKPIGSNDGSINDCRYFYCKLNYGIFISKEKLITKIQNGYKNNSFGIYDLRVKNKKEKNNKNMNENKNVNNRNIKESDINNKEYLKESNKGFIEENKINENKNDIKIITNKLENEIKSIIKKMDIIEIKMKNIESKNKLNDISNKDLIENNKLSINDMKINEIKINNEKINNEKTDNKTDNKINDKTDTKVNHNLKEIQDFLLTVLPDIIDIHENIEIIKKLLKNMNRKYDFDRIKMLNTVENIVNCIFNSDKNGINENLVVFKELLDKEGIEYEI